MADPTMVGPTMAATTATIMDLGGIMETPTTEIITITLVGMPTVTPILADTTNRGLRQIQTRLARAAAGLTSPLASETA